MADTGKLLYVGHTNPWGDFSGSGFSPRVCRELKSRGRLIGGIHPFQEWSLRHPIAENYNSLLHRAARKVETKLRGKRGDVGLLNNEADGIMTKMMERMEPGSSIFYHFHTPVPDERFDHRRFLFQDITTRQAFEHGAYKHDKLTVADRDRIMQLVSDAMHAPTTVGILTFSTYAADCIAAEYGVPREKITPIGCGPIRSYWNPDNVTTDRYAKARILFVGRSWRHKAGDALIDAFKIVREAVPHATLCIVGPTTQPEATVGIPGVEFYGTVPDEKVAELFSTSSMFCMVPECETWGIVYSEAAMAGLPIVGVRDWALPDIVLDGVSGRLVEEKSAELLSAAMIELLQDPERMEALGRAAHDHAKTVLGWEHVIDRLCHAVWPDAPEYKAVSPLRAPEAAA